MHARDRGALQKHYSSVCLLMKQDCSLALPHNCPALPLVSVVGRESRGKEQY